MTKKFFNIACGVTLILFGIFAVTGGLIPNQESDYYQPTSAYPIPSPLPPLLGTFTLYPIITAWRFYLFIVLFYIVFGLYVVYTSFAPRYKISLAVSFIMAALGGASSAIIYNKFITSYVYTDGNGAPALVVQAKDIVVRYIRLIIPNIKPYYTSAICAMFTHILLGTFVAVGFVLLLLGRPKKRKTKYWAAGIMGGIVFFLMLFSHIYIYSAKTTVYVFGFYDEHTIPYLLISILFSFVTSLVS